MSTVWAWRREELLSYCLVSPAVFHQIVDRLSEFVVPYQQALETEAAHPMYLYLQGLLSHLQRKNAEDIATLVDVEDSREMLGLTDNLRYNGLHHSSATQTRRVPVCVSNFNSSCAAMRVRKRPSPM